MEPTQVVNGIEAITILTWAIGLGLPGVAGLMVYLVRDLKQDLKSSISRLDTRIDRLETRLDKLQETMTDMDRRICRIEGALGTKEYPPPKLLPK